MLKSNIRSDVNVNVTWDALVVYVGSITRILAALNDVRYFASTAEHFDVHHLKHNRSKQHCSVDLSFVDIITEQK